MKSIFIKSGRILMSICFMLTISKSYSQIVDPVKWSYGIKKMGPNIYEVHLLAKIQEGWHIYAQNQSEDAVAVPTSFTFEPEQGLVLVGSAKEVGKKEQYELKDLGIVNIEFSNQVDFVQKIRLKEKINRITGTITYQACTHERCLAQKTIPFGIPVK